MSKSKGKKKPISTTKSIIPSKKIGNLNDIIKFINRLTTENISVQTDFSKSFDPYLKGLSEDKIEEFMIQLLDNEIFIRGRTIFPITLKIINIKGSEVQLKLIECISVVQELQDNALDKELLDSVKRYDIIALKGALDEFCYMVEPLDNELLILSKDKTHLRKTSMAVYINASKLISLESKTHGKNPEQKFADQLARLPADVQNDIIRDYILTEFDPTWIPFFSDNVVQRCLEQILMNPEIKAKINSTILLNLFQKFVKAERLGFLRLLAQVLDGNELNVLKGLKIDTKI